MERLEAGWKAHTVQTGMVQRNTVGLQSLQWTWIRPQVLKKIRTMDTYTSGRAIINYAKQNKMFDKLIDKFDENIDYLMPGLINENVTLLIHNMVTVLGKVSTDINDKMRETVFFEMVKFCVRAAVNNMRHACIS